MKPMTVFILHGAYGNANENWIPWLKQELEHLGCSVITPTFPTPNEQSLDTWLKVLTPYKKQIQPDSILIGHSLGATFVLHLLEQYTVGAAYLVAGFATRLNNPKFDLINATFVDHAFNWPAIKEHCSVIRLYHGDNDPYVSQQCAEQISQGLQVPVTMIPAGGHLNSAAGYQTFPLLLEQIKRYLDKR